MSSKINLLLQDLDVKDQLVIEFPNQFKENLMGLQTGNTKHRTFEQLRDHYEIEKKLSNELRKAPRSERCYLYRTLYNELYKQVKHHPQVTRKSSPEETFQEVSTQLNILKKFLNKNIVFAEVGPGDCALSFEVAKSVKKVYAIEVSDEIIKDIISLSNFQLILSDGCNIPLPQNSVDIVYSYQLMEHLHHEDAILQLKNIYNILKYNGIYLCVTPNRLAGPHDISKYFDTVATGFHLKEYTVMELYDLFVKVGFKKIKVYVGAKKHYVGIPVLPSILFERLIQKFHSQRKKIVHSILFKPLFNIRIIGTK